MKKQTVSIFLLTLFLTLFCIMFFSCNAMAELFHGPKPEDPPVTFTVAFNANGASGTAPAEQTVNADTVISLPDKGNLAKGGYVFVGWSESSSGAGTTYSVGASIAVTKHMVFYAQWLDGSTPQWTVEFNANGATSGSPPPSQTAYSGISITIPGQGTLAYSGKTFGGWNTQANGGGTNYVAGATYTVTGHITLYAKWQSAIQFTVTYHANGASGTAPTAQTVDPGTDITLQDAGSLTYTGRIFAGWNTNAGGTGTAYSAGSSYTVSGSVTLYAQWNIDSSPILVPGANLTAKFSWLQTNAESGGNYIIEADTSGGFGPTTLSYSGKNSISITLRSAGTTQTISLSAYGSMFTVNSGVTLVLENITLQGRNDNYGPLVRINTGGTFTMNDGTISGNRNGSNITYGVGGGGIAVQYGGTFTMNGGIISDNTTPNASSGGGGVRVHGGKFTMNDGIISDNNADSSSGGGVYVYDGTFTMSGGTISDNQVSTGQVSLSDLGGGVYVESGNFTMSGGNISTNIALAGGGVYVSGGNFTMSGGTVSGNIARSSGGGVQIGGGVFTKNGGTITGFTDDPSNGNVVRYNDNLVLSDRGHAVYAGTNNINKRMESTAGPTVNLSYDSTDPTWSGDWEY